MILSCQNICKSFGDTAVLRGVDRLSKGTWFEAGKNHLKTRLQWMAFYTEGKGRLYVDSGAARALSENGKSLLPSGVVAIEGEFDKGDVVDVYSSENRFLGRGIAGYDKAVLASLKGKHTEGRQPVAIHRNNWVGSEKIRLVKDEEYGEAADDE